MFTLLRTIIYASLFIGFVLIYVPIQMIPGIDVALPESVGIKEIAGLIITIIGTLIALWCIFAFTFIGKGTPAPFDPPRKLVIRGPYRYVRNPMYIGAGMALAGAALFYSSWPLLGYAGLLLVITSLFVLLYEEPVLKQTFGKEYEAYCQNVKRWFPSFKSRS